MPPIVRLLCAALLLGAAACDKQKASEPQAAGQPAKGADRSHAGTPIPDLVVKDGANEDMALDELKGSPVLINLWASWCAPCVKELPTLDALAAKKGAVTVVALSQDMAPHASVEAFLADHKLAALEAYHDPEMKMSGALGANILPTSVYYDKAGREVWRYVGDLDWTGPEATKLLAEAR